MIKKAYRQLGKNMSGLQEDKTKVGTTTEVSKNTVLVAADVKRERSKNVDDVTVKKTKVFTVDQKVVECPASKDNDDVKECIDLVRMLRYKRKSKNINEKTYQKFLDQYIVPFMGNHDENGNFVRIIPKYDPEKHSVDEVDLIAINEDNMPDIAYMAHHDTVHNGIGFQTRNLSIFDEEVNNNTNTIICIDNPKGEVKEINVNGKRWCHKTKAMVDFTYTQNRYIPAPNSSNCLGADCTTGVWLILEMIKARVPGIYVIHNDEEVGCVGASDMIADYDQSKVIAYGMKQAIPEEESVGDKKEKPSQELIDNYYAGLSITEKLRINPDSFWIYYANKAISFDRFGYSSIITHQSSTRTASDSFASDLSTVLSEELCNAGFCPLEADDRGSYTDSNKYRKHISECTNLSVGYFSQHSDSETQDLTFAKFLRDVLILKGHDLANPDIVKNYRDETAVPEPRVYGGYGGYLGYAGYVGNGMYRGNSNLANHSGSSGSYRDEADYADIWSNGFRDDDLDDWFNDPTKDAPTVREIFAGDDDSEPNQMSPYQLEELADIMECLESNPREVAAFLVRTGVSSNSIINYILHVEGKV